MRRTLALLITTCFTLAALACADDAAPSEPSDSAAIGKGDHTGPAAQALCVDTGGAWFGGVCDCEQDGASLGFRFDATAGCQDPGDFYAPLAERFSPSDPRQTTFGWADLVDARLGVHVVAREGGLDEVIRVADVAALDRVASGLASQMEALYCPLNHAPVTYSCEDGFYLDGEGYGTDGCYLTTASGYTQLSDAMAAWLDTDEAFYSDAELSLAAEVDGLVSATVVVTWEGLTLHFGEVAGALKLLVVDVAGANCDA